MNNNEITVKHPDYTCHDPVAAPSSVKAYGSAGWYDAMPPPGTPCNQSVETDGQQAELQGAIQYETCVIDAPVGFKTRAEEIRNDLFCLSMYGLGLAMVYWLGRFCARTAITFIKNHQNQKVRAGVMIFFAIVATCAAQKGTIFFPRTESDLIYIYNTGSYVTNDFIHVELVRHLAVPASAPLYIDYCEVADTNMTNVATLVATTFAQFSSPTNIPFANATNFNFFCYTPWTPGPTVHTNGVLHANWGTASGSMANEAAARGLFWAIPVQTEIIENGKTTFPPKTQPIVIEANLLNELNEESQNE